MIGTLIRYVGWQAGPALAVAWLIGQDQACRMAARIRARQR